MGALQQVDIVACAHRRIGNDVAVMPLLPATTLLAPPATHPMQQLPNLLSHECIQSAEPGLRPIALAHSK